MPHRASVPRESTVGVPSRPPGAAYPGKWVGRFIWDDGELIPFHYFLRFRKTFDLPAAPAQAGIRIAVADGNCRHRSSRRGIL